MSTKSELWLVIKFIHRNCDGNTAGFITGTQELDDVCFFLCLAHTYLRTECFNTTDAPFFIFPPLSFKFIAARDMT
jgi:hypothetical protein